jgi:hypothetical protein
MTRRLLNFLTLLSLLLCVASALMSVRSLFRLDGVSLFRQQTYWRVTSADGILCVARLTADAPHWSNGTQITKGGELRSPQYSFGPEPRQIAGFTLNSDSARAGTTNLTLAVCAVPWWFIVVVTAAVPATGLWRRRRRRVRREAGLCPRCGYDLRATPGRCPECGTAKA